MVFGTKKNKRNPTVVRGVGTVRRKRFFIFSFFRFFPLKMYVPLFVVLVSVSGFGYYFFGSQYFNITEVIISGASPEIERGIKIYFDEVSRSKKFIFFAQNKTLFFPKSSFRADLLSALPRIEEADIVVEVPHTLSIDVDERMIEGIWCASGNQGEGGVSSCYFYDIHGVIYEASPNAARGSLITLINDQRVERAELGDIVLNGDTIVFIQKLIAALSLAYTKPNYITVVSNEEIRTGFPQGWEAYFIRSESITEQVENLVLVLEREIGEHGASLLYIDLRLVNKVFYKLLEEEVDIPSNE